MQHMNRREVLVLACAAAARMGGAAKVFGQSPDPKEAPPRDNDRFTFASGPRQGSVVASADLVKDAPPVIAFPMDPETSVVRSGSRLNQVALIRLDPSVLAPETLARSADGVLAYSAICTHGGCEVTEWQKEAGLLHCPCHESQFDPRDAGRVKAGPAPRRLPALPLRIVEGELVAGGGFSGRVGGSEA